MKNVGKVLRWIVSVFLLLCALVYLPSGTSIFMLFAIAITVPIVKWQKLLDKYLKCNWIKPVMAIVFVFIAIMMFPTKEYIPSTSQNNLSVSSNDVSAVSSNSGNQTGAVFEDLSKNIPDVSINISPSPSQEVSISSNVISAGDISDADDITPEDSFFEIHFIDVGQADAALILCDNHAMLIDGGNKEDSNVIYTYLKDHSIDNLDYIICTHAHEDHVGGLAGALNYATVDTAYAPVTNYDSKAFNNFITYLDKQGKQITVPDTGTCFMLGSAAVNVIGPINASDEPNNTSIVLRVVYGETSFLFAGDAEREEEQDILDSGVTLDSTVLKVGHHGSSTSSTYPFLREIMPQFAIISVGTDNSYGHPDNDTLSRFRDADVKVYRTDLQGDIFCSSDGRVVSFSVSRNENIDTLASVVKESPTPKPTTKPTPIPTSEPTPDQAPTDNTSAASNYIGNVNSHIFHLPDCGSVKRMNEENKYYFSGTRDEIIEQGYSPCKKCNP